MPLGIILAAAWVEVLSPNEIVTELSQASTFWNQSCVISPSASAVCGQC